MTLDAAQSALDSTPAAADLGLQALRTRLDGIDRALLDTIRDRVRCCLEIGQVKLRHGVPMMQPHRIGVVQERAARYGRAHGLDPAFLHRLYEVIIAETCRLENLVISGASVAADEPALLAPVAAAISQE
jgi:4-amino-4-deoxychorismate mutase